MSVSSVAPLGEPDRNPGAWRIGRAGASAGVVRWDLERHCSMTPGQLKFAYLVLVVVSLAVALTAALLGAPFVLPFAGIEIALVGWAIAVHGRHARDREAIEWDGGRLVVDRCDGERTEHIEINGAWARIEPACGRCALVGICGQGRRVEVGRHVAPALRPQLARELCRALRGLPATERQEH